MEKPVVVCSIPRYRGIERSESNKERAYYPSNVEKMRNPWKKATSFSGGTISLHYDSQGTDWLVYPTAGGTGRAMQSREQGAGSNDQG